MCPHIRFIITHGQKIFSYFITEMFGGAIVVLILVLLYIAGIRDYLTNMKVFHMPVYIMIQD